MSSYNNYAAYPNGAEQPRYTASPLSEGQPYSASVAYPPISAASTYPPFTEQTYYSPQERQPSLASPGVKDRSSHVPSLLSSPPPQQATISSASARHKDRVGSLAKSSNTTGSRLGDPDALIRIPTKRSGGLLITVLIEAIIVVVLVAIIFAKIAGDIDNKVQDLKTVSVYLAIFVFGAVFQVVVAFDAVRLKNTIQAIGVCVFNVALTVAAALEITQIRDALISQDQLRGGIPCQDSPNRSCRARTQLYPLVERYLIVVTIICGIAEIPIIFWTAKLWTEFGWIVYQRIGADLRIRSMFLWYQTFIVLLKFCFFFGVGFAILYLILVADTADWEYGVTIAAVPIAVVSLFAAAFAVRRESTVLMCLALFGMIAGLVYFVYKLTQVWVPATRDNYQYVRLTITFISAFAIVALMSTLANGIVCLLNFNKGLKPAHDTIGTFGGVRRKRMRGNSNGNVLEEDYPVPNGKETGSLQSPQPSQSIGINAQQNATRISLD